MKDNFQIPLAEEHQEIFRVDIECMHALSQAFIMYGPLESLKSRSQNCSRNP